MLQRDVRDHQGVLQQARQCAFVHISHGRERERHHVFILEFKCTRSKMIHSRSLARIRASSGFAPFYAVAAYTPATPSAAQTTGPAQGGAGLLPAGCRRAGGGRGRGGGQAAEQGEVAVAGSRRGSQRRRVLARTAPITYDPTTTVSTRMLARHRGGWPGRLEAVTGAVFGICITFKFNVQSRRR